MIELYIGLIIVFAHVTLTNLENLRHTSTKRDPQLRQKINLKISELEKELYLSIVWPYLLIKKAKNEYQSRK